MLSLIASRLKESFSYPLFGTYSSGLSNYIEVDHQDRVKYNIFLYHRLENGDADVRHKYSICQTNS